MTAHLLAPVAIVAAGLVPAVVAVLRASRLRPAKVRVPQR